MGSIIQAKDADTTSSGFKQAQQHTDRRRFARSIWSQKAKDISAPDLQMQVIDRHHVAEFFGQTICGDNGGPHLLKRYLVHTHKSFHILFLHNKALSSFDGLSVT